MSRNPEAVVQGRFRLVVAAQARPKQSLADLWPAMTVNRLYLSGSGDPLR